jgi:hypothetical protein
MDFVETTSLSKINKVLMLRKTRLTSFPNVRFLHPACGTLSGIHPCHPRIFFFLSFPHDFTCPPIFKAERESITASLDALSTQ